MKPTRLVLSVLIWSYLASSPALACRYNVRDVGFVDFETEPYRFFCFARDGAPNEMAAQFKAISTAVLTDCNINAEFINLDQSKDHVALKLVPAEAAQAFPFGLLVSPDGQSLRISLEKPGQPFRSTLTSALEEIVSSPKRDEIIQKVSKDYAAILLIEGPSVEENSRARKAISEAIEQIRGQLASLPKAIANPPSLVVLDAASFARERILLWSLGLAPDQITQTRSAVIFGKARWIGPLMKGDEINPGNLARLLSIIGADCECGLDISWTQGTRLPVRWDEKLHTQVAKALGFDPENPLVKIEVGRIVGRRGSQTAASRSNETPTLDTQTRLSAATSGITGSTRHDRVMGSPDSAVAETLPLLQTSLILVACLTVVAMFAGGWILFRSAKKRRLE